MKEIQMRNAELIPEIIQLLNEGHTITLKLKGYSMRPFLESNRDKALITKAINRTKGDAVLAEISHGFYVLHRVIKIQGDDVTLRGEGNLTNEYCKRSDVKGFVVGFYRKGRTTIEKTNSVKWLLYSWLWMMLSPVRRYLLAFHRHIWLRLFPVK